MKHVILALSVLILLGCNLVSAPAAEQKNPSIGESFEMKIGESVTIRDEHLSFIFDSVPEDSRCPRGRVCIWAGNAVVVLKFPDSMESLNTYSEPRGITKGIYKISLLSLAPYPGGAYPIPQGSYVAKLVVNRN